MQFEEIKDSLTKGVVAEKLKGIVPVVVLGAAAWFGWKFYKKKTRKY